MHFHLAIIITLRNKKNSTLTGNVKFGVSEYILCVFLMHSCRDKQNVMKHMKRMTDSISIRTFRYDKMIRAKAKVTDQIPFEESETAEVHDLAGERV